MCAPPSRVWSNDNSFPRKRDGRLAGKHGQSPAGQARALQSVAEATGRDTARGHGFWGGTCHCRAVCSDVHSNSSSSALLLNSYDENNYTTYNTHTLLCRNVFPEAGEVSQPRVHTRGPCAALPQFPGRRPPIHLFTVHNSKHPGGPALGQCHPVSEVHFGADTPRRPPCFRGPSGKAVSARPHPRTTRGAGSGADGRSRSAKRPLHTCRKRREQDPCCCPGSRESLPWLLHASPWQCQRPQDALLRDKDCFF